MLQDEYSPSARSWFHHADVFCIVEKYPAVPGFNTNHVFLFAYRALIQKLAGHDWQGFLTIFLHVGYSFERLRPLD